VREIIEEYLNGLGSAISSGPWASVEDLGRQLENAREANRQVFFCGNGGSAANALHIANDLLYGVSPRGYGLKVEALPANTSVLTCLANDVGYEEIFAHQLRVKASADDVLVILSGSGNSPNVVKALEVGNEIGMHTFAVLGFDGGQCLYVADNVIHFDVHDMQVVEDLQLVVGHICMRYLVESEKN